MSMTLLQRGIREAMLGSVERFHPDTPLLLSGGADSGTVLAACLELGRKPPVYSFRLGKAESRDTRVATDMARRFGLTHTIVEVPRDQDQLVEDVHAIMRIIQNGTKTHVQCSQPFMYMARQIKRDGFGTALFAMAGDDALGTDRNASVILRSKGEAAARAVRLDNLTHPGLSDWDVMHVSATEGVFLADPFRYMPVLDLLLMADMKNLHAGYQKSATVGAFPGFWAQGPWYRERESLQVVSGLREFHDTLLSSPHNAKGHKAILGLYNEWLRGLAERGEVQSPKYVQDQTDLLQCGFDRTKGVTVTLTRAIKKDAELLDFTSTGPQCTFKEQAHPGVEEYALQTGPDAYTWIVKSPGRFINHACRPTAYVVSTTRLVAARDLSAGEEITFDYSTTAADGYTLTCSCGERNCRHKIGDFKDLPHEAKQLYRDHGAVSPHADV